MPHPAAAMPHPAAALPRRAAARRPQGVLVLAAALGLGACAGASRPVASERAVLEVRCPVADAVVWVDGRYVAQVRDLRGGLALRPGHHQIELRHERYHAYYGDLDIAAGQRVRIDVPLAEALP
jgi:hypothetical protein